jgi:hypothetical protein
MAATAEGPRRTVLWFRNDLRLHDSATVHEAAQRVKAGQSDEVRARCGTGFTPSQPACCTADKAQVASGSESSVRELGRPMFLAKYDIPFCQAHEFPQQTFEPSAGRFVMSMSAAVLPSSNCLRSIAVIC